MTAVSAQPRALSISDPSRAGEARRLAVAMAEGLGFDDTGRGRVAIVVTEAATNLLKHAGGGEILLRGLGAGPHGGLEMLALDTGPGMADVRRCLGDGYSTAGSSGGGLGAMLRLSDLLEIHSEPGQGTAILARFWARDRPESGGDGALDVAAVGRPIAGEEVSGDAWAAFAPDGRDVLVVADGLGHGPQAAEAAEAAIRVAQDRAAGPPADVIHAAHAAMRSTRGAAMAVAAIDRGRGEVRYAGVGNIAGTILAPGDGRSTSLVSLNGTVGHEMRKVQEFVYPWAPGSVLVMHSDGLATHWRADRYPGLLSKAPGLIAGVLYRDFKRGRDDVTVLAARHGGPTRP